MSLTQDVTLGNMPTAKKGPKKRTRAAFKHSRGDSEALFAIGLLGESGGGFRGDPSPGVEGGAWKDPQPHSCQRPESLPGTEADCPERGSQIPMPHPAGRTALVEGEGEGKWSPPGDSSMRSDLLWGPISHEV